MQTVRRWPQSRIRMYSPELLALSGNKRHGLLTLCGPYQADDRNGLEWSVAGIFVARIDVRAYMRIHIAADCQSARGHELWEDVVFLSKAFEILRRAGYEGGDYFGGDRLRQEERAVVLNPNDDFDAFAVDNGFQRAM